MSAPKVVVVGGGGVGTSVAFNLLLLARGYRVVVVDPNASKVVSHVMDLQQTIVQGGVGTARAGDDQDVATADVLVVSAATPLTVNTSRTVYLDDNAAIVGSIFDRLPSGWDGVAIMVTNPVDILCTWLCRERGFDRRRLLGYTLNDSLRLRTGVADALGDVAPEAVEAWVLGEHGDLCVPLLDRIAVEGRPVRLTAGQEGLAVEFVRTWYARHVALDSGRSSTWTSGLGVARMVDAVCFGTGDTWVASVFLEGEYGVDGASLTVPVSLVPGGLGEILDWPLAPSQYDGMRAAAESVARAADSVALLPR